MFQQSNKRTAEITDGCMTEFRPLVFYTVSLHTNDVAHVLCSEKLK